MNDIIKQVSNISINNEYLIHEFMGGKVRQRIKDGYFSATDLCKLDIRRVNNTVCKFLQSEKNKKFLKCLEEELNINSDKQIKVIEYIDLDKNGNGNKGTMIHPAAATYLAMWISSKFSVKVTLWIEEWRKTENNNIRYTEELYKLEQSSHRKVKEREYEIQLRLAKELNAEMEVKTPTGFIDLLNEESIIEIKRYSHWKHALGQIICYSKFYPLKQKVIYLFGDRNIDVNVNIIEEIYSENNVKLILLN